MNIVEKEKGKKNIEKEGKKVEGQRRVKMSVGVKECWSIVKERETSVQVTFW